MSDVFVSQREFAHQCGKNAMWVNRRIKEGKIPVNSEGLISLEEGFKAFKKLVGEKVSLAKAKQSEVIQKGGKIDKPSFNFDVTDAKSVALAFAIAKLEEKKAVAELKALELKEKQGEMIPVAEVKSDAQRVATLVRERLLTIPVRYAGVLEGRTQREIESVLEQAVDEVLIEFQKSKFTKKEG